MSDTPSSRLGAMGLLGIASDHAGYALKEYLSGKLRAAGFGLTDFGDRTPAPEDDYPEFVGPLAKAVATGAVLRGIAVCGSGVGACLAANQVRGVRACLINETFSARQGVEDDDLNMICLGGQVVGPAVAWEIIQVFLAARFVAVERHVRRLKEVDQLRSGPPEVGT